MQHWNLGHTQYSLLYHTHQAGSATSAPAAAAPPRRISRLLMLVCCASPASALQLTDRVQRTAGPKQAGTRRDAEALVELRTVVALRESCIVAIGAVWRASTQALQMVWGIDDVNSSM